MIDLEKWERSTYKISDMKPYGKNPRNITKEGLAKLRESLENVGYVDDIALFKDGTIAGGHARYYVFKDDKIDEVPVKICRDDLTDKEKEEAVVRLNKNIAGTWDFEILANEFEIDDLVTWGFKEDNFDVIPDEVDMPDLGDGSDPDIQQCTFTLSNEQKDILDDALNKAKNELYCTDEINQNTNGNKLSAIMRWYCGC